MANPNGLEFAAKTDPGQVRSHNEDAIALSPAFGFAVLADGMGGYNAGEIASEIATSVVKESLEDGLRRVANQSFDLLMNRSRQIQQLMVESIQRANKAILDAAQAEPQYQGMGTTLVAVLFQQDRILVAHVGDSRAYRYRQGELTQITKDHSLLQEQIDAGLIDAEAARFSHNKNLVTRAVGVDEDMDVEIHDYQVEPEDMYLLCSDGLSDMLATEEIREILAAGSSLDDTCDALVQRANQNGGFDNVSALLVKVRPGRSAADRLLGRLLGWVR